MLDLHLDKLPSHMREGVETYIMRGIPPGSFLNAILSNNLSKLMRRPT